MTSFDIDADANTAVTALLAQFVFSANGNIREGTVSDTFHVYWLHRAAQKIAYDFSISGDDQLNLAKPNPSKSAAIGTIITLEDHTTGYATNYNITATEAENFFGGSIEQNNGDDRFSGLKVVGSAPAATQLMIIQANPTPALLTSHWGTGKNDGGQTLLRILIQTRTGGADIDGQRVIVKANEYKDTSAVWRTQCGLGEAIAAINTASDPQNQTNLVTVDAYIGIAPTEGYGTIDISDGSGLKPYLVNWTYAGNNKKALYEWVKAKMARGSTAQMFGMDGQLFTGGATFSVTLDAGAGGDLWVQNEVVSWGTGTGVLMAVDDFSDTNATEMWIHISSGINPTASETMTGAAASNGVATITTYPTPSPNHLGQFTGNWIGDFGIGFAEFSLGDTFKPLDLAGATVTPPNNVNVSVVVNGATNSHVMLAKATGGIVDQTQYTAAAGQNSGNSTLVIQEAIDADTPTSGWCLVSDGTNLVPEQYDSWAGSTFQLTGTLTNTYSTAAVVIIPILYDNVTSDGGNASTALIQSGDIDVAGWVRNGVAGTPFTPAPISGTIGAAGLNLSVNLSAE